MATFTSLLVGMFEEQAALLIKHIAILKANDNGVQVAEVGPKKKLRVPKAAKDPNEPKKSLTAYHMYLGENQVPFKASNPTMSQADIMATLGRRWTALTPDAKERFIKLADAGKVTQSAKMAAYLASNDSSTSSSSVQVAVKAAPKVKAPKVVAEPVAEAVALPKTPITAPASLEIFTPIVAAATSSGAEEKEHKKKKKRKSDGGEEAAAPVAAVIEALPVAVPESEKKKVCSCRLRAISASP